MLLQNAYRDAFTGLRYFGAGTTNGAYPYTANAASQVVGSTRNLFASEAGISALASIPDGCRHPIAWVMPQKPGGLSARNNITGSGSITAGILAVKLAEADLTGSGALAAVGSLIVQAIAAIAGSGTINSADLKAFLQAVAAMSGSGGVSAANRSALGAAACALTGIGTAAGSTATGIGEVSADLVVTGTGLTTANVGDAVWSALAAANNGSGTMGEKLNDAGSASNPWTEVIESGYTAEEVLRILLAVAAGKSSGGGTTNIKFRNIGDTTDRIDATVDASGNRSAVTLDPT
jgi:hypothetical protein